MRKQILFLAISLVLFSCTTTSNIAKEESVFFYSSIDDFSAEWNFQNSYFERSDFYLEKEKSLCHLIKIDLTNPELKIFLYTGDSEKIKSIRPSELSKITNADIIINTVPWSQKIPLISEKIPVGIVYKNGITYSTPNKNYGAISLVKTNSDRKSEYRAEITDSQKAPAIRNQNETKENFSDDLTGDSEIITGGFWQILKDGEKLSFKEISDSRTALAISSDQKTLYILIVEGEKKSHSKGLSYGQCADIFIKTGAFNAIELDGGSSTTLYIYGKNVLSYKKNPKLPAFLCFSKTIFDK